MRKVQRTQTNYYSLTSVIRSLLFWIVFLSIPIHLLKNIIGVDQAREHDVSLKQGNDTSSNNRFPLDGHSQSEAYPFLTGFIKISDFVSAAFSGLAGENKKNSMEPSKTGTQSATATHKSRHQNSYDIIINRSPQGSFVIEGVINKTSVIFLVDTGASFVTIPGAIAKETGLRSGRALQTTTASDVYTVYETIVPELSFGNITLQNIHAVINPRAPDDKILLGMTALQYLTVHQENGQMVLSPQGVSTSAGENGSVTFKRSAQQCNDSGSDQIIINARVLACMRGF
jgi:clan AA aspartic protease (TIGR02281 family)